MNDKVGVWIDHEKALVVAVTDDGEAMSLTVSKTSKQLRRSGDSPLRGAYEPMQVPADDARQRALSRHLNAYYDAVTASVRTADSILVFGPGEAKEEFRHRLEEHGLGKRIVAVETADKMTDRQVAAKVRKYFA